MNLESLEKRIEFLESQTDKGLLKIEKVGFSFAIVVTIAIAFTVIGYELCRLIGGL